MKNVIEEIVKFQKDRKLNEKPYSWENEASFIIEELMEAVGVNIPHSAHLTMTKTIKKSYDDLGFTNDSNITTDKIVDAFGDVIVYAIGAIMKLGYNPECVLGEIAKEINSRSGKFVNGKFEKDVDIETYAAEFSKCKERERVCDVFVDRH